MTTQSTSSERDPRAHTARRPWPLPPGRPVMAQVWHDLLFAHWPLPPAEVRRVLPPALELDTFDGAAWVGVVPFRMSGIRPLGLPAAPWLSAFAELNVRTYVIAGGRPGVYFWSLDAANPVAVALARAWYGLPYYRARMLVRREGEWIEYASRRGHGGAPPASFDARYRPTGEVSHAQPGTLEHWLTERYALYVADGRGRVRSADVHHAPWPLQPAEAELRRNTMAEAAGLSLPDTPPLLHFARRLDVLAWNPALAAP